MLSVYDRENASRGAFFVSRPAGARAVDLLERLVAIPSITGAEEPLLAFLERRYLDSGWTVENAAIQR